MTFWNQPKLISRKIRVTGKLLNCGCILIISKQNLDNVELATLQNAFGSMKNLLVEYHVPTISNGIDHQSAANSVLRKLQEKLTNLSRELRENFNISSNRCKIAAFFASFCKNSSNCLFKRNDIANFWQNWF